MQSFSPQIIKHYIPLDFSKQVINIYSSPRKIVVPKEENPFTNKKLMELNNHRK